MKKEDFDPRILKQDYARRRGERGSVAERRIIAEGRGHDNGSVETDRNVASTMELRSLQIRGVLNLEVLRD